MSTNLPTRKTYPSDVADDECAFIAPYLTLMTPDALQRRYTLREVFNALRYLVRSGIPWRMVPNDLPPWPLVYQQMRRWMAAECFEAIVQDLRILLRRAADRPAPPTAAIVDARTIQSTPESGARAGYDGHKRRKGSKVHAAVDTLGHLLALSQWTLKLCGVLACHPTPETAARGFTHPPKASKSIHLVVTPANVDERTQVAALAE